MKPSSPAEFAFPELLFELSEFEHRELFRLGQPAWTSLGERLIEYMDEHCSAELLGTVEPGATVKGKVFLAPGASIEAGAYVQGPAILGPRTVVRHGAYLRGYVLAGSDCILGHSTEVKQSVLLNWASAGHFAYVGDSILGNRANLGAGTKLANFRVVPGNVKVLAPEGQFLETGMLKLGALLGDDVQVGCNAVTAPGTVMGRGSCAYSLTSLRGTIPPHTLVAFKPQLVQRSLRRE